MTGSMSAFCSGEHGAREEFEADGLSMLSRRTADRSRLIACVSGRHGVRPSDAFEVNITGGKATFATQSNLNRLDDGMAFIREAWADEDPCHGSPFYVNWTGFLERLGFMGIMGDARNTVGAAIAREALGPTNIGRLPYFNRISDKELSMLVNEGPAARHAKSCIDAYPALSSWLDRRKDGKLGARVLIDLAVIKLLPASSPLTESLPAWLKGRTWRPPRDNWLRRDSVMQALSGIPGIRAPQTEAAWQDFLFVAVTANECLDGDSDTAIAHLGPDWSTAASHIRRLLVSTATAASAEKVGIRDAVSLYRTVSYAFQSYFVREVLADMDAEAARILNLLPPGSRAAGFHVGRHGEQAVRDLLWPCRSMEETMRLAAGLTQAGVVPAPRDSFTESHGPHPRDMLDAMWPIWATMMRDAPSDWRCLSEHPAMEKLRKAIHEDITRYGKGGWR